MLWMKYLYIHALSVSIYPHRLLGIYLGYRKTDKKLDNTFMWCSLFLLKALFDTQKEGSHFPNYNEMGFFDNFKLM